MPQSFVCLNCHIIFSTKNREPLILPKWSSRLYKYFGGILHARRCALIAAGGMPDHVHLIASLGKEISVASLLRDLKSNTSRWIHNAFDHLRGFAWQSGYGAFAVCLSQMDSVKKYIVNQQEHHRVQSFQEEFLAILKKHNIEYDERYIWD